MRSIALIGVAAAALVGCSPAAESTPNATESAPAVSPSVEAPGAPRNEAVAADGNMNATGQTPGANSFTESQARERIEAAGYTGVGALTQNAEGLWQGSATREGAETRVSVDYRGAVTPAGDAAAR